MSRITYVNGRYAPYREATVHIEDRGYQFADGAYEYIAFYNGILLDNDLHLKRLERSLQALEISLPMPLAALRIVMRELIECNGREDGGLYLQVTRGVARRDHPFPKNVKSSLVMTIGASKLPKEKDVAEGVKVITADDMRWRRRDIKSISLLPNILAKQQAMCAQAREAWLIEDGKISEGAASNAYIVTASGKLVTHPANEHILGGVTRDIVLKLARKAGIMVEERPFTPIQAWQAAEAFLTSTSANILPVVRIDNKTVGNGKPGSMTRQLMELYKAHIFKQTGKKI